MQCCSTHLVYIRTRRIQRYCAFAGAHNLRCLIPPQLTREVRQYCTWVSMLFLCKVGLASSYLSCVIILTSLVYISCSPLLWLGCSMRMMGVLLETLLLQCVFAVHVQWRERLRICLQSLSRTQHAMTRYLLACPSHVTRDLYSINVEVSGEYRNSIVSD